MTRMTNILLSSALSLSALFTASAATAEDTTVHIYERGFYPMVVYYTNGDRLRYVNETPFSVQLELKNGSRIGGEIAPGDDLVLFPSGSRSFTLKYPSLRGVGRYGNNTGVEHVIKPGAAPLS